MAIKNLELTKSLFDEVYKPFAFSAATPYNNNMVVSSNIYGVETFGRLALPNDFYTVYFSERNNAVRQMESDNITSFDVHLQMSGSTSSFPEFNIEMSINNSFIESASYINDFKVETHTVNGAGLFYLNAQNSNTRDFYFNISIKNTFDMSKKIILNIKRVIPTINQFEGYFVDNWNSILVIQPEIMIPIRRYHQNESVIGRIQQKHIYYINGFVDENINENEMEFWRNKNINSRFFV